MLRHESGLNNLDHSAKLADFSRENIKANVLGHPVEEAIPQWPVVEAGAKNPDGSETRRHYHSLTRGWILNEIIRRVDPNQRTLGEILQEDLQIDDIFCGLGENELKRTANLTTNSKFWILVQSLTPKGYFLIFVISYNTSIIVII